MRSLNVGASSAVAIPIGMDGDPPLGRLDSIDQIVLGGSDFAVAVSKDYILARVQRALDDFKGSFDRQFTIHTELDFGLFDVEIVDYHYRVSLTSATASWMPLPGHDGALIIVMVSGEARTHKSSWNVSFDVTQRVSLTFYSDDDHQMIVATPFGSPSVNVSAGGILGMALDVFVGVKSEIESAIKSAMPNMVSGFGTFEMTSYATELGTQLRTLDGQAGARFDRPDFGPDGLVLGGRVMLSSRQRPITRFVKTNEQDGYSAFQSWIPGGRIDRFEWSWSWSNGAGRPGTDSMADRFVLKRPRGGDLSKFGHMMSLSDPLPGLDGTGSICLNIKGVRIDPYSGDLVPIETGWQCSRFGFAVPLRPNPEARRLLLREYEQSHVPRPGPRREVALVEVSGLSADTPATNTLVVRLDDRWDRETAAAIREGLAGCERDDAGLMVLVLFRDGLLGSFDADAWEEILEFTKDLEAPLLVNEDVQGGWSTSLGLPSPERGEPSWRLISPRGGVTWMHDGHASGKEVAAALDGYLFPSAPPSAERQQSGLSLGSPVSPAALDPHFPGVEESACPPPPLGRGIGSLVAFVQRDSTASKAYVEQLKRSQEASEDGQGELLTVVVDGASREVDGVEIGERDDFVTIPDPVGAIARRFEIRHWPTAVRVNERGTVTAVEVGLNQTESRPPPKSA
jgi:hypothetical protein